MTDAWSGVSASRSVSLAFFGTPNIERVTMYTQKVTDKTSKFKSKAAAKRAGYKTNDELELNSRVLLPDAQAVEVKGVHFYSLDDTRDGISVAEGKRRKLKLKPEASPRGQSRFYTGRYWVRYPIYLLDDFSPMQKRRLKAPEKIDLLLAIWTVNRAAKRLRDLASSHYIGGRHGFAGHSSSRKSRLYRLKEIGIVQAYEDGRIICVGIRDEFACFVGEGYYFHSRFVPEGDFPLDEQKLFVDAKQKSKLEARLKDAIYTLETLQPNSV